MNTAMAAIFFLPSLILVLSVLRASFARCPRSEYNAPNGTVHHSGFTDDNNLTCTFNIRVPFGLRAVLEIKKLKVMGRMPNCENGSLEIRVGQVLCFISFRKSVKWRDRTSLVIVFKSNAKKFLVFTPILYKPNLKARKHRVSPIYSLLMRTFLNLSLIPKLYFGHA